MPQRGPLELAAVDGDRGFGRAGGDLVGDRQDTVKAVLASDVQVGGDLFGLQFGARGLDFDEARPALAPTLTDDRSVRYDGLARRRA